MAKGRGKLLKTLVSRDRSVKAFVADMEATKLVGRGVITEKKVFAWYEGRLPGPGPERDAMRAALGLALDAPDFLRLIGELPWTDPGETTLTAWLRDHAAKGQTSPDSEAIAVRLVQGSARGLKRPSALQATSKADQYPVGSSVLVELRLQESGFGVLINHAWSNGIVEMLYPDKTDSSSLWRSENSLIVLPSGAERECYPVQGPVGPNQLFVMQLRQPLPLIEEIRGSRAEAMTAEQQRALCKSLEYQASLKNVIGVAAVEYEVIP